MSRTRNQKRRDREQLVRMLTYVYMVAMSIACAVMLATRNM